MRQHKGGAVLGPGRAHSLSDIAFRMPAQNTRALSDVGSSCAADREDPTSQKRAVVERDEPKLCRTGCAPSQRKSSSEKQLNRKSGTVLLLTSAPYLI